MSRYPRTREHHIDRHGRRGSCRRCCHRQRSRHLPREITFEEAPGWNPSTSPLSSRARHLDIGPSVRPVQTLQTRTRSLLTTSLTLGPTRPRSRSPQVARSTPLQATIAAARAVRVTPRQVRPVLGQHEAAWGREVPIGELPSRMSCFVPEAARECTTRPARRRHASAGPFSLQTTFPARQPTSPKPEDLGSTSRLDRKAAPYRLVSGDGGPAWRDR